MKLIHDDLMCYNKLIGTPKYQQMQQNTENHPNANYTVKHETMSNIVKILNKHEFDQHILT